MCTKLRIPDSVYCRLHHKMFVLEKLSDVVTESDGEDGGAEEEIRGPKEDQSLVHKVNELEAMITQLTETVKQLQISRKVTPLSKAMRLYYHDHKKHPQLFEELEKRQTPFIIKVKKDEDGNAVSYKSYNWRHMKSITDEAFKNLSEADRAVYIERAAEQLT